MADKAPSSFDLERRLVTSYLFNPTILAGIRLLFALFTLATLLFGIIWQGVKTHNANTFFSYFTNLTLIGICSYFFASGVQTYAYATRSKEYGSGATYPLQRWPRALQYLHELLYTTIVSFPLLVTVVYWALLSANSFADPATSFSNISKHALNSAYAIFEITMTNVAPLPWLHLPITIVILGGYVGVAYITHETQHFYPYSFLDPKKEGAKLAAYIVGIAVGQVVFFVLAWGLIKLRIFLVAKYGKTNSVIAHQYEEKASSELREDAHV